MLRQLPDQRATDSAVLAIAHHAVAQKRKPPSADSVLKTDNVRQYF